MKHDTYQELLALDLYGELPVDEARTLSEHLETCAACRALRQELDDSLGPLARREVEPRADDLPADWDESLRRATVVPARASRARPVLAFAAGLAAGILLMWTALAPREGSSELGLTVVSNAGRAPVFASDGPPPPATSRGQLSRLGSVLGQ